MPAESLSDFFKDPTAWKVIASGQAEGRLVAVAGPDGKPAMRLDYDFHGGGGFVVIRRQVRLDLPETFEFHFSICGAGPKNHFEFKIADPEDANAWRFLKEQLDLPADWQKVRIRERDLPFAWGPAGGGGPKVVGAVELVVAAGPGGKGSVSFSDLILEDQSLSAPAAVSASSHHPNHFPESVFAVDASGGWQADAGDSTPWWLVDFGRSVRFGGLVIQWPSPTQPRRFEIETSADGREWTQLYQAACALGAKSHIPAPQAEARYLRLNFANPESAAFKSIQLRPDAFTQTPNEFIHAVAADYPRGWFPRYWSREQSYWTPIGNPEGRRRGLINEEGMVEVDEAGFSLEPFLIVSGRLRTWADAEIRLSLAADGTPFPEVVWQTDGVKLTILPWVDGSGDTLALRTTYQVENPDGLEVRLVVAVRPFQVNPPWQAFRNLGGRSPIRRIRCDANGMTVEGRRVIADRPPETNGVVAYEQGGVVDFLSRKEFPADAELDDESGLASAAMSWKLPTVSTPFLVTITVPFFNGTEVSTSSSRENAIARWEEILAPVRWQVPSVAGDAIACFRTAASHILINRDGPAIQPGPRRYTRSWVRDCVIMGAAMAKVGCPHVLREFLVWYVQFQHEDGHVPCVVDRDGVDVLVEHDSHGQLIWGICELFRNDGDIDFLESMWQPVHLAADYLLHLRSQRMTRDYREPERADCYGLLPESASHEGYLAHPVHSYWDDFWGIRGLEAAAELAAALGHHEESARWRNEAQEFLVDTRISIERVIEKRNLSYIPGSLEWADFDPTATSNAIAQLDFADDLPAGPLHQTLETYLTGFRQRLRGEVPWLKYTAYEIRIISAFVRLGQRDEAHELLDFFLADRRPLEWNQWPEITWRDPRAPGHLGDVPHTWIAAEYMLAVMSMVASDREASEKLVLASGLPWCWISMEKGFSVSGLMTRYGRLDFQMSASGTDRVGFSIGGGLRLPPGGIHVAPPLPPGMRIIQAMSQDGGALEIGTSGISVALNHLPVTGTLFLASPDRPVLA
ncbi:MAG: discoidin domain-containing protein [Luteolibacter sp.]